MFEFRTDLADERRDIYRKANKLEDEISGIEAEDYVDVGEIKVSKVKIVNKEGEEALRQTTRHIYHNRYKKSKNST